MTNQIAPRDVLGEVLTEVGSKNKNVVVLDADYQRLRGHHYLKRNFGQVYSGRDC